MPTDYPSISMTPEQKQFIDESDYETLLRRWRFSPSGDPILSGEAGEYYQKVMFEKRDQHPNPVGISKRIGW